MVTTDKVVLNKQQKTAVSWGNGPLLIIAGAGTGKTTVITERLKYLILEKKLLPAQILALTFTEKAAREMEERVDIALPYGYSQMWISTFHSFSDRVLRAEALHIGLDPHYRLMTEAEAVRFMKANLFLFGLSYFRPLGNPTKFLFGLFQHFCRLKDEDILPRQYLEWARKHPAKRNPSEAPLGGAKGDKHEAKKWLELAGGYQKYEELKTEEGVMDFADLISNTLRLFRQRPNVLTQYKDQFKYILVDEYQDTNIAQNELVKLLAGRKANLTVVADDDQGVYKWRGAAISNVIQFRKSYPQAGVIALTQNYRSTQGILDAAYGLIQNNNPDRLEVQEKIDKKLTSVRKIEGHSPEFIHTDRVENEADTVAKKIVQLVAEEDRTFADFAILVRANIHSEPFVRAFSRAGIPYQFLGPGQLFHQPEVKDIVAYLKVLYNFEDSQAFYRVVCMQHLDIPARDLAAIVNYARKFNFSLFEAAEKIDGVFVSEKTRETITKLVRLAHKHLNLIPTQTAGQLAYFFLEESGLLSFLVNPQNAQEARRSQNIAHFFDRLKTYEAEHQDASVFAVVDWIELSQELGESPLASNYDWAAENAVSILTVHSAKGLEFPVVFVVNLVDQRFPTRERREQIPIPDQLIKEVLPQGDYHLQEERRLAYVAATRAMDRLYFTAANYYGEGKREKKISPFVVEALGPQATKQRNSEAAEQLSILDFAPVVVQSNEHTQKSTAGAPITYLSYSQIETFRFCPMHYKMKYILRIPTPSSAAQSFGSTIHTTLKDFYELARVKKVTEQDLLQLYEHNWAKEGYASKEHEASMKKRGLGYLASYLKTELHSLGSLPLALERPFSFPLHPQLKVGGRIDRIDKTPTGIEIIDYKTTDLADRDLPAQKDLEKDLQLSVYALAATEVVDPLFSKKPEEVTLSLYFFDKGVKVSTTRTREQLEQAKQEILKAKEAIETSDFICSGNLWCRTCEYKLFCEVRA